MANTLKEQLFLNQFKGMVYYLPLGTMSDTTLPLYVCVCLHVYANVLCVHIPMCALGEGQR